MKTKHYTTIYLYLLFLVIGLSACASADTAPTPETKTPEPAPMQTNTPTPNPGSAKQQEIMGQWLRGSHSRTFDRSMSEYPNCARCHSPQDWETAPGVEPSLECLAYLPPADVAQGAAGEAAYHYVSCEVCHSPGPDGVITGELSWMNPETKAYEPVAGPSELCVKCHTDTSVAKNGIDMGQGPHTALECTACHNSHRLEASCTNGGCHSNVAEDVELIGEVSVLPGHEVTDMHTCGSGQCHPVATQIAEENQLEHIGLQHATLNCTACHDATGMALAPQSDGFHWTTWQTITGKDGKEYQRPFFSHNVQREVDCTRCHYANNPWKLPFPVNAQ